MFGVGIRFVHRVERTAVFGKGCFGWVYDWDGYLRSTVYIEVGSNGLIFLVFWCFGVSRFQDFRAFLYDVGGKTASRDLKSLVYLTAEPNCEHFRFGANNLSRGMDNLWRLLIVDTTLESWEGRTDGCIRQRSE